MRNRGYFDDDFPLTHRGYSDNDLPESKNHIPVHSNGVILNNAEDIEENRLYLISDRDVQIWAKYTGRDNNSFYFSCDNKYFIKIPFNSIKSINGIKINL